MDPTHGLTREEYDKLMSKVWSENNESNDIQAHNRYVMQMKQKAHEKFCKDNDMRKYVKWLLSQQKIDRYEKPQPKKLSA